MDFSRFFIDRPIFAAVLSILIFVTGLIAIPLLPVSEYPDVVPPSVQVRAEYPGANPKVIAETVATPLEEAINGVENMMYMKSVAGSDGVLVTTVTFRPGTDPDQAQVQVQNRVSQAEARLPEDVRRLGITTQKQSPTLTLVVHLFSPNGKYDSLYMRNYATLKVKDELARLPGVGQIQIFGSGEYAMRVWLDPNKVAARGLTASDVVAAMQEQNVQVSAGQLGAEPLPKESDFLISINAQGRLHTEEEFGNIILKTAQDGSLVRLHDVARIEMGSGSYALRSQLNNKDAVGIGIFQSPGANAIDLSNAVRAKMSELATRFPEDMKWAAPYDPTVFVRDSIRAVVQTLLEAVGLVVLMGLACKNAILIVEFARELEMQGKGIVEAALEACRLRLRPIVMTSIAFIAGTIPLILGHGAGAEVRGVTGITVFSGMLGVTLFGLFLTPVFYVALRKFVTRGKPAAEVQPT